MDTLTGEIEQRPPSYSAKHVDGTRAYELARRGADFTLPPVRVVVHAWQRLSVQGDCLSVRVTCGGGTYIRALARDLGRALGSAAHCCALRRVASGPASVTEAVALDRLQPGTIAGGDIPLRPPLSALGDIAREELDAEALRDLSHGRAVRATGHGNLAALLHAGRVVGIARRTPDDRWQPKVVLLGEAVA
jgi:tRNA pseudouridine55 synthase